jgi:hypothetical protein
MPAAGLMQESGAGIRHSPSCLVNDSIKFIKSSCQNMAAAYSIFDIPNHSLSMH